ncbi:MAG TPA: NAD-dependent succinate-semialdehyde dehydrogenase [Acidimicrobiales bacterium]|nr:NAD-dependent succinate-semialdehyde dehydrogenase [Acidimicrobiales bacterium]
MDDAHEREVVARVPTGLFIGGSWRDTPDHFDVEDPATGDVIARVSQGTPEDGIAALDAACAAQDAWAATAPRQRGEVLRAAFELLTERIDDLALLMTLEMGKPIAESKAEITYAADFFRWFSEEAVRIDGRWTPNPNGGARLVVMRQPVGPCLFVTPWNFPMAMGTRKIGPAVAAGCTMVCKPASLTPLSMLALAELLTEAGLPKGVLNLVPSTRSGDVANAVLADPRLRKLSFTGSTEVGRVLLAQAAPNVLRVSMELGGNAPFVVFDDADVGAAVEGAVTAKMRNIGEACTAANRFLVQRPLVDDFAERLAERLGAMKVGRGTEPGVEVGPLIDEGQRKKVAELVDDAVAGGATVLTGGHAIDGPGYFYAPTVLTGIPANARLRSQEIFGPVAPVMAFGDDDEGVAEANNTEMGLVAYVYTNGLERAFRVCERLQTGMVGLNQGMVSNAAAPFGGVKQSGFGREGGHEGINEYLNTKYVALRTDWSP